MKLSFFCLLLVTLIGCSAQRIPDMSEEDAMRIQFTNILKQTPISTSSIRSLGLKSRNKQLHNLSWEIYLYLCQSELDHTLKQKACRTSFDLAIVNNEPSNLFNTAVFAFHHTQANHYREFAKKYATTKSQKAMLIIAQGQIPEFPIEHLLLPDASTAELDYLIGKKNNNMQRLNKALKFFADSHLYGKVADVLFVKAKLAWNQRDQESAKIWASESALLLEQIKRYKQASFVREWFDDRFSAG